MSAIKEISRAVNYDVAESMLASGCSLNDVYARVNALHAVGEDMAPESTQVVDSDASSVAATIAPKAR